MLLKNKRPNFTKQRSTVISCRTLLFYIFNNKIRFLNLPYVRGDGGLNGGLVDVLDKADVDAMFGRERG